MVERGGRFDPGSVPENYARHLEPVIFGPWAERLVDFAELRAGQTVLDVAAGAGAVARAAATRVGPTGRVMASDISPGMLARVTTGADPHGAALETLECPATQLRVADASIDMVLCQQGLPFISDRRTAAEEMRRVLRPGGTVAVAVWLAGVAPQPFASYAAVLRTMGVGEPFRHAFDVDRLTMSLEDVRQLLVTSGFVDVRVTIADLELTWPDSSAMALGIAGTPYGPMVAALEPEEQRQLLTALSDSMTDGSGRRVRHVSRAVLGTGTRR